MIKKIFEFICSFLSSGDDTIAALLFVAMLGALGYIIKLFIEKKKKEAELELTKAQLDSLKDENRRNEESHQMSIQIKQEELKKLRLEIRQKESELETRIETRSRNNNRHGNGRRG